VIVNAFRIGSRYATNVRYRDVGNRQDYAARRKKVIEAVADRVEEVCQVDPALVHVTRFE